MLKACLNFWGAPSVSPSEQGLGLHRFTSDCDYISKTVSSKQVKGEISSDARIIVLVKPQFEVGRKLVGKGGIVRDPTAQAAAVEKVRQKLRDLGFTSTDVIESPILGAEGNREFLLYGTL